MESPSPTCVSSRNFQHVSVGKCHAQTATDRFGDGAKIAIRDRERASLGMHPHNPEMPFTWPGPDSDDEQETPSSIYRLIPSMQKFRNNLTALSQVYNLYFVTYQGRIFVYRPRTVPTQTLPRRPDLQLAPKPSVAARSIGGFLDTRRPHLVNNIVTGFLGKEEVVVACFDDGDVVAYYVREVAERVFTRRSAAAGAVPKGPARCFFHENVGISAWGLAVHPKSRLIAVSSNRHEVTVFAFGLASDRSVPKESLAQAFRDQPDANVRQRARNWRIVVLLGTQADNIPNVCFIDDDDGFADKICAIDIKGAMWLAAIWKTKQPPIYIPPLCHPHLKSEEFYPAPSRGWGVFAIPESSFVQVETTEELFGLSASRVDVIYEPAGRVGPPLVNVRRVLNDIPGNPCRLPPAAFAHINQLAPLVLPHLDLQGAVGLLEDVSDASDMEFGGSEADNDGGDEMEEGQEGDDVDEAGAVIDAYDMNTLNPVGGPMNVILPSPWFFEEAFGELDDAIGELEEAYGQFQGGVAAMNEAGPPLHTHKTGSVSLDGQTQVLDGGSSDSFPTRLDMTFFPHNGLVHPTPRDKTRLLAFLERPFEYNTRPRQDEQAMAKYANKLHLLRTYEKDIEMRGFCYSEETGRKECGVLCPDALNFGHFRDPGHRNHFHATSRLNMFAHAPELGLVVIGSPTGRVVLLTLTRMAVPAERPEGVWEHGFRVEWVLPTQPDEEKHRKVLRPLHGMALGPVQVADIDGRVKNAALPQRYRLMLHYRNHDILSYEISREDETGKLCIF